MLGSYTKAPSVIFVEYWHMPWWKSTSSEIFAHDLKVWSNLTFLSQEIILPHLHTCKFSYVPQFSFSIIVNLQYLFYCSLQFDSVSQSCPTPCDPMPGFHHKLPELAQTHVHWVGDAIQPSHPSVIPFSSCLQSFPASGSFPVSQFFASSGWSIGVSASASLLPMNIQDWFPLGWTGWIFLLSKGLSKIFFNITVQKYQFFGTQLSSYPPLISIYDYWKNHSFD